MSAPILYPTDKQLIAEKKKRTLLNINSQIFQLREDFKQINFGLQKEQSALEELYSRQYKIKFKKLLLSERYQVRIFANQIDKFVSK